MKAVKIADIKKTEIIELPEPSLNDGNAVVKIEYGGICGSDTHFYLGMHPSLKPPTNFIQGHEAVGVITKVGPNNKGISIGDHVAINPLVGCGECVNCIGGHPNICRVNRRVMGFRLDGTLAQYITLDLDHLVKLDKNIDLKIAATFEPLAVGYHAVKLLENINLNNYPIIITGGGTIGVVTGLVLKHVHNLKPIIIETNQTRVKLLNELGFTVKNSISEIDILNSKIRPIIFECSGVRNVLDEIIDSQRKPEYLVLIAQYAKGNSVNLHELQSSEITVISSHMYTPKDLINTAKLLSRKDVQTDLSKIIYEKVFSLDDADKAFQQAISGNLDGKLKVLIKC
ncbi:MULTISPECIES: zinc-dependent alcohol dehydrogenase [Orbaceae]|uniref:zinc-dependent alcohol dehydrogenase n=1 Tax=Orbaceae TaxID=1240483 RepID=UPI000A348BF3|nr:MULTISPECIES: alcohol dehydrogenase catalytic domain-containing protein [Orbaceae]MCT6876481.1 alcohol dehydrogenase catalytic domain-containing protein [Frischella perrara]OTQ57592.1 oxidoreductase, zinc-binding dehydrogenase [Gilliamella sp. A7]